MITNEMKAKIAMLYYPCDVLHNGKIRKLNIPDIWGVDNSDTSMHFKLLLTPLSGITDEDIEKILELEGIEKCGDIERFNDRFEICYFGNDGWETRSVYYDHLYYPSADFLRSKGYALPAFGIDLIEAGIAIHQNKETNDSK